MTIIAPYFFVIIATPYRLLLEALLEMGRNSGFLIEHTYVRFRGRTGHTNWIDEVSVISPPMKSKS